MNIRFQRGGITLTVFFKQCIQIEDGIALINTAEGSAITNKMLGCTNHTLLVGAHLAGNTLNTRNNFTGIGSNNRRFATVALIGTTPAIIFNHGNRRCKHPINACYCHFTCGNLTNLVH